jgi:hypothetical protein
MTSTGPLDHFLNSKALKTSNSKVSARNTLGAGWVRDDQISSESDEESRSAHEDQPPTEIETDVESNNGT